MKHIKTFESYKERKKPRLNAADMKFLMKFLGDKFSVDNFSTDKITRTNQFSGEVVEIDPISAACYDLAMMLYNGYNNQDERFLKQIHPDLKLTNVVMNFDRAKYIVLKMDPNAYSKLLD